MGTSLADRAWGTDSAVYRVAGVINVIGGWFFTALSAFLVCGGIVYLIHWGGFTAILLILGVILFLITRNFINHRRESKEMLKGRLFSPQSDSYRGIIEESVLNISNVIGNTYEIYASTIRGLSNNDLRTLSNAKKNADELFVEVNDMKNNIYYFLKRINKTSVPASRFYISLLGIMSDLIEDLIYISNESFNHINNNHKPLKPQQISDLNEIFESLSSVFKEGIEAFNVKFSDKEFNDVLIQKKDNYDLLNQKIDDQILRIETETSPKNTALYFNILIRTKDLILHKFDLVEEFYRVSRKLKY